MKYIAWCDGSVQEKVAYVSYDIQDESGKSVLRFKGRAVNLRSPIEAEYLAFYLLIREIKELGFKDITVYTDCENVMLNFKENKPLNTKRRISFKEEIEKRMDEHFLNFIKKRFFWKSRKHNQAHKLFKKKYEAIDVQLSEDWFPEARVKKSAKIVMKPKEESLHTRNIPHTRLTIDEQLFQKFHRTTKDMKDRSEEKTMNLLSEKLRKSMSIQSGETTLYVRGSLHVSVKDDRVQKIVFKRSVHTLEYKKIKNTIQLKEAL